MVTSLSDLPEDIIAHIFSYIIDLNNYTAIGLSLLSKHLLHVVQKHPRLVFDSCKVRHKSEAAFARNYRKELEYIRSTLDRYHRENLTLETFSLIAAHSCVFQEVLHNRCIELAAKNGPRNLKLWMTSLVPQCVFELESLVELNLRNCCLMPEIIAWPNLKRLIIEFKCETDEDAFGKIIRACPSIEYLNVNSRGFTGFNFKVSDLPNLKELNFVLKLDQHLEVNATPNLESMQCSSSIGQDNKYFLSFGGTKYPSLRSLKVTSGEFDRKIFIRFALKFPALEILHLESCESLQRIDLSSTSLKEIKLVDNSALREACFDVPNLVHFEYKNHARLPKLKFARNSSRWSSFINLSEYKIADTLWFLELNKFLAALNMSETSISVQFLGERAIFTEAHPAVANSVIPVSGIRDFSIDTSWSEDTLSYVSAILDGIFSICQPRTITFLFCSNHKLPQLLHEKLVSKKSRHYRAITDFEMFEGSEEECSRSAKRVKVEWDKFVEVLDEKKTKNITFQLEYSS